MHRYLRRAACAAAITLTVAACGSDGPTAGADDAVTPSTTAMTGHDHGVVDVDPDLPVPAISIEAIEDPKEGFKVHATLTNFTLTPENASTAAAANEGHMHLYVDGEKVGRIYNEWFHVTGFSSGEHDIRVELSGNDHTTLGIDGAPIDDTLSVTFPMASADHMHGVMGAIEVAEPAPTVDLTVTEDPKSGFNVHAAVDHFTFAPEHASTAPVDGEGHMHLYVDGQKIGRLYGAWAHVDDLAPGEHTIRVELNANNHAPLSSSGEPIIAEQTVMVAGSAAPADMAIEVMVAGGDVSGVDDRVDVPIGSVVAITVMSDAADDIHVHGYDVTSPVEAGGSATVTFEADIPGVFDVELEKASLPLFEIQVS